MANIINKTLDLAELNRGDYDLSVEEIKALMSIMAQKALKFTNYQAKFDDDWGKDKIWFRRKQWEVCTLVAHSDLKANDRILDCGGASSMFSFYLADKGYRVDTIDIDWQKCGIVANANAVARAMGWKMANLEANVIALPYKSEVFERVFSVCMLEHLAGSEQLKAIKEMARVLKQVGNLDYAENGWFREQPGKTWGCLFLKKPEDANDQGATFLSCSKPAWNAKVKLWFFCWFLEKRTKDLLWTMGIRRSK